MSRIKLETSFSPKININQVDGSLRIKGWDRSEFRGDADYNDTLDVKQKNDTIEVYCTSGCLLRVPMESTLKIGKVARELMIKSIEGEIEIGEVNQQTIIKNVSKTSIQNSFGNLNAKQIEGDLRVKTVRGDAIIRDVDGDLEINENNGNFNFRGLAKNIKTNIKGNAMLRLEPEPEGNYEITATGNINCKVSPGTSAKVLVKSGSNAIRVKTPDYADTLDLEEYSVELGEGESKITLNAQGRVDFIAYRVDDSLSEEFEFELGEDFSNLANEITQQVTEQIESQIDSLSSHLNEITAGVTIGTVTSERSRHKLEAKRRSLERKLRQAQNKADRKLRAVEARKRAHQHRSHRGKLSDPVTDEERKMILEMLQSQKISVEEAETLLAALEGQAPLQSPAPLPPKPPEPVEPPSPPKPKPKTRQKTISTKNKPKPRAKTKKPPQKKSTTKNSKSKLKSKTKAKRSTTDSKAGSKTKGSKE
jgi:hypothetical protein